MRKIAFSILGFVASIAMSGTAEAGNADGYEFRSLAAWTSGGAERCLGISSGSKTVGASVVVWNCDNSYNQRWNQEGFWPDLPMFSRLTSRVLLKPPASSGNRCLALNGSNLTVTASCTFINSGAGADPANRGWWADFHGFQTININGVPTSTPCYTFKSKTDTITPKYLTTTGANGNQPTIQNGISGTNWQRQVWCPVQRTNNAGPG
jgi:hypothetical protein